MAIVEGRIKCSGCGEMLPLDAFAPSFAKRGRGRCRPCHNRYGAARMAAAAPEVRDRVRVQRQAHYEKTKEARREKNRALRQTPEWRARRREWVLSAAYGLGAKEYDRMLAAQGGGCACCGARGNANGKRLFVDHDHATGEVRGLLCGRCNTGIGNLGDTVEGVSRALAYLQRQRPVTQARPSVRINLMEVHHVAAA